MKHLILVLALLAAPTSAVAGTIIWEAFGEVSRIGYTPFGGASEPPAGYPHLGPPAGTPYSIRLVFDPDARVQTPTSPPGSPCSMTGATGTMQLGGFSYSLGGNVFTNAHFPVTNCYTGSAQPTGSIDFFMFVQSLEPDPWDMEGSHFLELKYWDLLHQNGTFPTQPTVARDGWLYFQQDPYFTFSAPFAPALAPVGQPTPVPEPGTLTMVGIGLALAARRRLRR